MSRRRRRGHRDPQAAAQGRGHATSSSPTSTASSHAGRAGHRDAGRVQPGLDRRRTPTRAASPARSRTPSPAPTSSSASPPPTSSPATTSPRWPTTPSCSRWPTPTPRWTRPRPPEHAAVVATGRSDFANQINNVLVFPGVFRGLLDAATTHRRRRRAARRGDAPWPTVVTEDELNPTYIMPSVFHPDVAKVVAAAVEAAARSAAPGGAATRRGRRRPVPHRGG